MEAVIRFVFSTLFFTGAAYIMNKYGLNVIAQPFDFIMVASCFAIGNAVLRS